MFEEIEDEKGWFQEELHEHEQISVLSDWIEDRKDDAIERVGEECEEDLRRIFHEVKDAKGDATRKALVDELKSEGFSAAVATLLYEAASEDHVDDDLSFVRRNTDGPDELRVLSRETVALILSEERDDLTFEPDDELMSKTRRIIYNFAVYQYYMNYDGHTVIYERLTDANGYSEADAEAFLAPILAAIDELGRVILFNRVQTIRDSVADVKAELRELHRAVEESNERMEYLANNRTQGGDDEYID